MIAIAIITLILLVVITYIVVKMRKMKNEVQEITKNNKNYVKMDDFKRVLAYYIDYFNLYKGTKKCCRFF